MKNSFWKKIILLILALGLAVSLLGCGEEEVPEELPQEEEPEDTVKDPENSLGFEIESDGKADADKIFTLRYMPGESMNPIYCRNVYNDAVTSLVYEGLFELDKEFRPVNVLCSDYWTSDGYNYFFELIDTNMSDGAPLTVDDVVYSINRARNSNKFGSRLSNILYCANNGDGTVLMQLGDPDFNLPSLLDVPIIRYGTGDYNFPVGSGPYKMHQVGEGNHILLANSYYRDAENIPLERIYLASFKDGEIVENFSSQALDLVWEDATGDNTVNLHNEHETRYYDTAIMQYIGFNSTSTPMSDINIRRAIQHAVNRNYIIENVFDGKGRQSTMRLNPAHYAYSIGWEENYGYSAPKISENLVKSNLKDANSDGYLEYPVYGDYQIMEIRFIVYAGNQKKLAAAESIAENLRKVGLNIELDALSWDDYVEALENGWFDMYYAEVSFTRNFDFTRIIGDDGSLDYGGMGSEKYELLCETFTNATTDENKISAAKQLCTTVAEDVVIIPILYRQYGVYTHRGVISSFTPTVSGVFNDVTAWVVDMPS